MKKRCGYLFLVGVSCLCIASLAQETKVVVANAASKEMKRTARRLRIPIEQLKHAREALQDTTDLARTIDPYPTGELYGICQSWLQIDHSKAKGIMNRFIGDLRSLAADASDIQSYRQATSTALTLMQWMEEQEYEKVQDFIRSWPEPRSSLGDESANFRKGLESQVRLETAQRLVYGDPEKAIALLREPGIYGDNRYSLSGQIAQSLMSAGKREEALKIIDQTAGDFDARAADPRDIQDYENFIRNIAFHIDSARAATIINQWITQLMKQPSADCTAMLKKGDQSLNLTCEEAKALTFVQNLPMRPGLMMKTLESVPGLQAKVDGIGGVDELYGSGIAINMDRRETSQDESYKAVNLKWEDPSKLFQELRGKAESNPDFVRRRLREAAKDPDSILLLTNLAGNASWPDPELGILALELARSLLPGVMPLQNRAMALQNLIQSYRQVEGSVDSELLKTGFLLADQLREEAVAKKDAGDSAAGPQRVPIADQLELLLLREMSRDSFEDAVRYARSIEDSQFRLQCLIQIVQALSFGN